MLRMSYFAGRHPLYRGSKLTSRVIAEKLLS